MAGKKHEIIPYISIIPYFIKQTYEYLMYTIAIFIFLIFVFVKFRR